MKPFSSEHQMFRQSVRSFVEKDLLPQKEKWEEAQSFPREIFKKLGNLGFLGIRFPEELGGSGLDYWYTVCFLEELVACRMSGLAMDVMVQSEVATPVINILGTEEQKREYLVPAICGEKIAAIGVTEPDAGSDVSNIKTSARREGGNYIINGSKIYITNGTRADFIILAVRTGKEGFSGLSLIIFPTDTKGFSVAKKLKKLGMATSDTALIYFDNCLVPEGNLLGQENQGFYHIMQEFHSERLGAAVACCAESRQIINDAIRYGRERKAFGQPIINFQVWRHKFAQRLTELEAAKQLTYNACDLFNRGEYSAKAIAMAKLFSSELANQIAYDCLQFHGGAGFMAEFDISRSYRDLRFLPIGAGTSEIMREIIAKHEGF